MYEWTIIGGGVQGVTMATFLLQSYKTTFDKLRIIDPNSGPLENWERCTQAISMPFLRSPSVHHIEVNPFGLERFAKQMHGESFYGRFKRPSLSIFKQHCDHLFKDLNMKECWIQGRVKEVQKTDDEWKVDYGSGNMITTKNIVIAIGIGEQPHWPDWAIRLKEGSSHIHHVFENDFNIEALSGPIVIVGGGMTAAHLANKMATAFPGDVKVVKRHPFRIKLFDSDPGWLGPKKQRSFRADPNYASRRKKIIEARHRGSITQDLHMKLHHLKRRGLLDWVDDEITTFKKIDEGIVLITKDGKEIFTQSVVLATGFNPTLPGSEWIIPLIKREQLKCADCGYPIVTDYLKWGEGLYVTGALAELQIGPIARNISGARQAAEQIVSSI
ncbi:FAD/NAD(P)-binding protein [Metabacillus idriensis]|uniref:FAD/NAD(P)-binding protein n=1 Tax=Metabacillus idriensis TaxID=324768 RepID=UPI003D2CD256